MKADQIKANFTYPCLTAIVGKPSYESIKRIKQEILENAASVHSTLGGGQHRHIGLMINTKQYKIYP